MNKKMNSPKLEARRSCQLKPNCKNPNQRWRSEVSINNTNNKRSYTIIKTTTGSNTTESKQKHKDYYKKYEHDEVPVKDNAGNIKQRNSSNIKIRDNVKSITNSQLDRLEENIFKNMSQEIKFDHTSKTSLESNIKYFKQTVQEIFTNFHSSMRDFDVYKKKLTEILTKTQTDSMAEMENFIKDIIENIVTSEASLQSPLASDKVQAGVPNGGTTEKQDSNTDVESNVTSANISYDDSVHLVEEAYKNENYLTDSSLNDNSKNRSLMDSRGVNVYFLSTTPYVIKMNDRSLMSDINIKDTNNDLVPSYVASTENIKKITAKKIEIERYNTQPSEIFDREIPVKVSFARNNLCFEKSNHGAPAPPGSDVDEGNKSFIARICSFICKKIRKNSIG